MYMCRVSAVSFHCSHSSWGHAPKSGMGRCIVQFVTARPGSRPAMLSLSVAEIPNRAEPFQPVRVQADFQDASVVPRASRQGSFSESDSRKTRFLRARSSPRSDARSHENASRRVGWANCRSSRRARILCTAANAATIPLQPDTPRSPRHSAAHLD